MKIYLVILSFMNISQGADVWDNTFGMGKLYADACAGCHGGCEGTEMDCGCPPGANCCPLPGNIPCSCGDERADVCRLAPNDPNNPPPNPPPAGWVPPIGDPRVTEQQVIEHNALENQKITNFNACKNENGTPIPPVPGHPAPSCPPIYPKRVGEGSTSYYKKNYSGESHFNTAYYSNEAIKKGFEVYVATQEHAAKEAMKHCSTGACNQLGRTVGKTVVKVGAKAFVVADAILSTAHLIHTYHELEDGNQCIIRRKWWHPALMAYAKTKKTEAVTNTDEDCLPGCKVPDTLPPNPGPVLPLMTQKKIKNMDWIEKAVKFKIDGGINEIEDVSFDCKLESYAYNDNSDEAVECRRAVGFSNLGKNHCFTTECGPKKHHYSEYKIAMMTGCHNGLGLVATGMRCREAGRQIACLDAANDDQAEQQKFLDKPDPDLFAGN